MDMKKILTKNVAIQLWICILLGIIVFIAGYKLGEEMLMRQVLNNSSQAADRVMQQFNNDIDDLINDFNY